MHAFVLLAGEAIAALIVSTYDREGYTLSTRCGVIDPRHRKSGLTRCLLPLLVLVGRAIGAETVMGWVTLRHIALQLGCERTGFGLWGLIPASERYEVGPGTWRYGFEALYGVTLVPPALSRWPDESTLPPARAALLRALR